MYSYTAAVCTYVFECTSELMIFDHPLLSRHTSTFKQLQVGEQLTSLESKWSTLVSGNVQLEIANLTLEMELDSLREREAELKGKIEELEGQQ